MDADLFWLFPNYFGVKIVITVAKSAMMVSGARLML